MKIDTDHRGAIGALPAVDGADRRRAGAEGFADALAADALRAGNDARRAQVLAAQPDPTPDANADDIAAIREHGMRHYAVEMHRKKLEELREKILEKMGLSEEDLEAMPADQRSIIEDMIGREIEARLAADSLMNGDAADAGGPAGAGQFAAAAIASDRGGLASGAAGLAVMAVLDAADAAKPGTDGDVEPPD